MLRVVSKENILVFESPLIEEDHDFFIGPQEPSLDDFFKLYNTELSLLPEKYLKICTELGITGPDRINVAPPSVIKKNAAKIANDISSLCSSTPDVRYLKNYVKMRKFLDSMSSVNVDLVELKDLIETQKHQGVKTNLATFLEPVPVKYSMSNSATGRLSVTEGPKILTSPNEVKSTFRSRYKSGSLLQIDLSCAEPNFALFVANKDPIRDIYSFCAKEVLQGRVDRSTAKLVLLSAIYGQSAKNLSANIPSGINAVSVAKNVKNFLDIPNLKEKLLSSWSLGECRNHLGRPLKSSKERVLVSHYLQSSIAEASILMFDHFCSNHDVIPVFVIHDALIIDCEKPVADRLLQTKDFNLFYENVKFPATITKIG